MNLLEEKSKMITINQPGYPKLLKNIARPPKLLSAQDRKNKIIRIRS